MGPNDTHSAPSSEDILRALALRRARSDSESSSTSALSAGSGLSTPRRGSTCRHNSAGAKGFPGSVFPRRPPPPPTPPERQGLLRRAIGTFVALFSLGLLPIYLLAMLALQRFWRAAK